MSLRDELIRDGLIVPGTAHSMRYLKRGLTTFRNLCSTPILSQGALTQKQIRRDHDEAVAELELLLEAKWRGN